MSNIKRSFMEEDYKLIDGVKACEHSNFNDYFEKCDDCNMSLYDMPDDIQESYSAMFEDDPETLAERAETIRDGLREDGIAI